MGIFFLLRLSRIITRRPPWELKAYKTPRQFRFRLWGFSGVVFLPFVLFIPSLFSVPFFSIFIFILWTTRVNCSNTTLNTFSVNNHFCLFVLGFIRRVAVQWCDSSSDLAAFSNPNRKSQDTTIELKQWSLSSVPFSFSFCWTRPSANSNDNSRVLLRNRRASISRTPTETLIKGQIFLIIILIHFLDGRLASVTAIPMPFLKNRKIEFHFKILNIFKKFSFFLVYPGRILLWPVGSSVPVKFIE